MRNTHTPSQSHKLKTHFHYWPTLSMFYQFTLIVSQSGCYCYVYLSKFVLSKTICFLFLHQYNNKFNIGLKLRRIKTNKKKKEKRKKIKKGWNAKVKAEMLKEENKNTNGRCFVLLLCSQQDLM